MKRLVSALASVASGAVLLYACAIDPGPFFTASNAPDNETAFLKGELGIITPDLEPRYELLAFRALSGLDIDRLTTSFQDSPNESDVTASWIKTRNTVANPSPPRGFIDRYRRLNPSYVSYANCLGDAFQTAARTLDDRRSHYGNPAVFRAWIEAQDQVFEDCSAEKPVYPAEPGPDFPPLARADRMYQIAAAHFYAQDLSTALNMFRAISQDTGSPWNKTATYLMGRVYLREVSLGTASGAGQAAREQFQKVASDTAFGSLQNSARGLLLRIDAIEKPSEPIRRLAEQFIATGDDASISQALLASQYVLRAPLFSKALQQPNLPDPFDWITTLDSGNVVHTMERWRTLHTLPWLTLALSQHRAKMRGHLTC